MTDSGSRRGAANLTPILMILSFAAMAGLLWWLSLTAEGTEPVVMEEDTTEVDSVESAARMVTRDELRMQPDSLLGQMIRLVDVPIASTVGGNAFLVELGTPQQSSPFLVVLDSALIADRRGLPQGRATVAGTVRQRTDSIVGVWVESGLIPSGQRVIVEFASFYIDATRVRGPGMSPPAGADTTGSGGESGDGGADGG